MAFPYRRVRKRLGQALALTDSLVRVARQADSPSVAEQSILDRAPLIDIHIIDALRAVQQYERKNRKCKNPKQPSRSAASA